jgi:hypothetical protein
LPGRKIGILGIFFVGKGWWLGVKKGWWLGGKKGWWLVVKELVVFENVYLLLCKRHIINTSFSKH